jgi:ArsR family transcriptional regulator
MKARRRQTPAHAPVCDVVAINDRLIKGLRKKAITASTAEQLALTFKTLGHSTRVRIVDALSQSEMCVCDLAALLDMRISAVSHQLALLKQLNMVKGRREGKMMYYALDDMHMRSLFVQGRTHARHGRRG